MGVMQNRTVFIKRNNIAVWHFVFTLTRCHEISLLNAQTLNHQQSIATFCDTVGLTQTSVRIAFYKHDCNASSSLLAQGS